MNILRRIGFVSCLVVLSSTAWAFPYGALTGPQLAAAYGWKDLGTQGLKFSSYDQIYAVGLIQVARNARDTGNNQMSYLGGGLLVEAGGQQFLVCAGNAGNPGEITPANGLYKFFNSDGGTPSPLNRDNLGNNTLLKRNTYSAWPLAMFADHERWEALTDQAISITNKPGYADHGCVKVNNSADRWYIGPASAGPRWSLAKYGLSDKLPAKVYAVGWRWSNLNLITVQTDIAFGKNVAQYVDLVDRDNPALYHYYSDPRTFTGPNGQKLRQVIVAIDSEGWGATGNVIICIQYSPKPDDTLNIKAHSSPKSTPAKVWFQPSSSATMKVKVDAQNP